jgi:hypothetical protein
MGAMDAHATCHEAIGSGQMSPRTWDILSVRPGALLCDLWTFVPTARGVISPPIVCVRAGDHKERQQ